MARPTRDVTVAPAIAVGPRPDPIVTAAIERGGGRVVSPPEQADALVWLAGPTEELDAWLTERVTWVQLRSAGVEAWIDSGRLDDRRQWTSAAGVYGPRVAEHALSLLLAGVRRLHAYASQRAWIALPAATLQRARVGVVGSGGIGRAIANLLAPFGAEPVAINRTGEPVPGFSVSVASADVGSLWPTFDHVVLAAPLTISTRHLIAGDALSLLPTTAWIVNVARGALIDTPALVTALRDDEIGGAALDVTDPEPLPKDHALWRMDNVLITPHQANPLEGLHSALAERVEHNVRRFRAGQDLLGIIDRERGY